MTVTVINRATHFVYGLEQHFAICSDCIVRFDWQDAEFLPKEHRNTLTCEFCECPNN